MCQTLADLKEKPVVERVGVALKLEDAREPRERPWSRQLVYCEHLSRSGDGEVHGNFSGRLIDVARALQMHAAYTQIANSHREILAYLMLHIQVELLHVRLHIILVENINRW